MPRRVSVDFVRTPPTPPKPSRLRIKLVEALPRVFFKEEPQPIRRRRVQEPLVATSHVSNNFAFVGTIDLDPSDSDVVESPIDKEDDFEPPSTNESPEADLTAAFVAIAPEERTTLSRKRRKLVMEGLENDHCVQYLCGLKSIDANPPTVCVITDHPSVFQDNDFEVLDAGHDCCNFEAMPGEVNWQEIFAQHDFIVVAIGYSGNEIPLGHARLLHDLEMHAEADDKTRFLHIDSSTTTRWEQHVSQQTPYLTDHLGFTRNDEQVQKSFEDWSRGKTMDHVLSSDMGSWLKDLLHDLTVTDLLSTAFPAFVHEERVEHLPTMDVVEREQDVGTINPVPELIEEETLLDEVDIPGLPLEESERRRQWRKLPQRVRIGVRRLHHQFGHVPRKVLINLLRAAKVHEDFVKAVRLHRCQTCEDTSQKQPTHKTQLPGDYRFNHTLGIDLFEVIDIDGAKFQVLNMVCVGTTFQQAHVVRQGPGQCSSSTCLKALQERWFSWAGHPVQIICDRGLHNREVLQKYMDEHNILVFHTPLESPEGIRRVERHGGLLKGMYRKICHQIQIQGREQVETDLSQACMVKNEQNRVGGFSPTQWALGKGPPKAPGIVSEEQWAQLGAIEAKYDRMIRQAFLHCNTKPAWKHRKLLFTDCSRRVQKALLRNASTIKHT